MNLTLTVVKGEDSGKAYRLTDGEAKVLGRSSRTDILVQDVGISRQHCQIRLLGGQASVKDLNSKNGTSVNGQRIHGETPLVSEDLIEIGRTAITVQLQESAATPLPIEEPMRPFEPASQVDMPPPPISIDEPVEIIPPGPASSFDDEDSLMGAFSSFVEEETVEQAKAPVEVEEPAPAFSIQPIDPIDNSRDPLIDKVIAGCRVEEQVGSDEISLIYRALQISMDRPVALKVLLPEMTHDKSAVDRFIGAARSGGKLNHPNIVQVLDAGDDDGRYFIALELVDGKTARALMQDRGRKRALDSLQAVDIAMQIAAALAYAHGRGLIHGNISPDNIVVTRHGIAKLANLGFLRNLEDSGLEAPSRPGEQLDALHYSAPEVLRDQHATSVHSDIYSLGAVLFLMLSGHPPFRGANELEIMEKVQQGQHESLRKLHRSLPDKVIEIVDGCLMAQADQRHANAGDLESQLRNVRELLRN